MIVLQNAGLKYIRTAGWGGVDDELQGLVAEVIQDVAGPTDHEAYRTWQRAGELFREGYDATRAVVQCDDPKETYRRRLHVAKVTMKSLLN